MKRCVQMERKLVMAIGILCLLMIFLPFLFSSSAVSQNDVELDEHPWSSFGGNERNTGMSPYDTGHVDGTGAWRFETGDIIMSSPVVDREGTIYFGSKDHNLYAVNPDGTLKWTYATGDEVISSPAIGEDGTVYFGSSDKEVYAINPDGTLKWSFKTDGEVHAGVSIGNNGTIYISSTDRNLYALNPNGTLDWSVEIGLSLNTPAIGADGMIYVGSSDMELFAINPNGTVEWTYDTWSFSSSPAIGSDGTIYVGSYFYMFTAINPNGTRKWSYQLDDSIWGSPAIGEDGMIYVTSHDNNLYAFTPEGTIKWSYNTEAMVFSSPTVGADGTIYVGSYDNKFYAINPDGSLKWSFRTKSCIYSSPAIGEDGTIYVGSFDGHLYAFGEGPGITFERDLVSEYISISITVFISGGLAVLALFIRYKKTKRFQNYPVNQHNHSMLSKIQNTADLRVFSLGIFLSALGFYLFFYIENTLIYGYPYYPYRDEGQVILFMGILIGVIGALIKKVRNIDTPLQYKDKKPTKKEGRNESGYNMMNYVKKPGMKKCPICSEEAVVVEDDNSAFCERCGYSSMDFTLEVGK